MNSTPSPSEIATTKFEAEIRTDHAGRYLQQLCKHWSHRFTVEYDASRGVVQFKDSRCAFEASSQHLLVSLTGADREALQALREVLAEHLKRFAFREEIGVLWREVDGG
jgi:hypothetical protein